MVKNLGSKDSLPTVTSVPPFRALALLSILTLATAESSHARDEWKQWFNPRTAPFIPIPEVGTDPNSGTTLGLLPVWLQTNAEQQIRNIIAPDLIYNPNLGYGARFRYYAYPSEDTQWYLVTGGKQHIDRELDLNYSTGRQRRTPWTLQARLEYDRSGTQRFFGLGNDSRRANESNFTRELAALGLTFGLNLNPHWQLAWETKPRYWQFGQGAIDSLPNAISHFPAVTGFAAAFEWHNRLSLRYDSRDSIILPTVGSQFVLFAGVSDRSLLSHVSYTYFGFDARHYRRTHPHGVLATHLTMRYMPVSNSTPFWALSRIGGDRSVTAERQALRGFGEDRFVGRNMLAFNVEWRLEALRLALFGTQVTFEVAPFLDSGSIFNAMAENPLRHLHWVGGLGIRGIAKPYVVGYLDAGYGVEGLALFSGIDYPF